MTGNETLIDLLIAMDTPCMVGRMLIHPTAPGWDVACAEAGDQLCSADWQLADESHHTKLWLCTKHADEMDELWLGDNDIDWVKVADIYKHVARQAGLA